MPTDEIAKPSQWNCPNCGHEMIGSGVDMETFEQVCHERDAALEKLAAPSPAAWQPIETAPKNEECWFWIVPKNVDETYYDTSNRPILARFAPFAFVTKHGCWMSLAKATHWMPYYKPLPPPPSEEPS